MRKPAVSICENKDDDDCFKVALASRHSGYPSNKGADHLCGYRCVHVTITLGIKCLILFQDSVAQHCTLCYAETAI